MSAPPSGPPPRVLNVSVGVLGHVDSGKTSLVAALSTVLSTAALDKHPQSKERGITLDLGFSSFSCPMPPPLSHLPYDILQFTLVDCPGHASLIRHVIGGAQIIDMAVLVIDATKGIQTQTAECLVVAEITIRRLVVALNKIDLIPEGDRGAQVEKVTKKLGGTFAATKFKGCPIIPVSARPGGSVEVTQGAPALGVDALVAQLIALVPQEPRVPSGPFLFAVDHCFPVKGQGTVLTGTVLSGTVSVGDEVEVAELRQTRKVRSMQAFRRPQERAVVGDRVGLCLTQLDASLMERGLASTPGVVPTFDAALARVDRVRFFKGDITSKAKFHVTVGHMTVMAEATFFGLEDDTGAVGGASDPARSGSGAQSGPSFDFSASYLYQEELFGPDGRPPPPALALPAACPAPGARTYRGPQWAMLRFERPVTAPGDSMVIGSRLDQDIHVGTCRLAFSGRLVALVDPSSPKDLERVRIYKSKRKEGVVERVEADGRGAIGKGMFKKDADISLYSGMKVVTEAGEWGVLEGPFGKSGKFRLHFPNGIGGSGGRVFLIFKRFIFDKDKRQMRQ